MLYKLKASNSSYWTYAYTDLSSKIKTNRCDACGRSWIEYELTQSDQPITFVIENHARFADVLNCCGGYFASEGFIISQKALDCFIKEEVTGFSHTPVRILREINKGQYEAVDDAVYYLLDISGRIDVDYEKMHLRKKHVCQSCKHFDLPRQKLGISYLDYLSWNGCDINRLVLFPGHVLCTDKVLDIIRDNRLKGFEACTDNNIFRATAYFAVK